MQPPAAVTDTLPVPAASLKLCDVGVAVKVQAAPVCVIDTVCPPTVTVPVRGVAKVLAAADNATVPLPDPLLPEVIVSHEPLLVAVHAHPDAAVTATDSAPPAAVCRLRHRRVLYEQVSPAWVTLMSRPATVSVPVRGVMLVFAATA